MVAANTKMLESEAGFRVLFECATVAILVTSDIGVIVLANPCANSLFGYMAGELIDKPVELLVPDALKTRHRDHRRDYFQDPRARPMGLGMELFARKKGGDIFPVEISLGHFLLDGVEYAVAFVTDVTEAVKARKILSEREAWFKNIAENSPVMIWMSAPDKKCNYFNQSWLEYTGRTMEQELGFGWAEGVHSEDLDRCLKIYNEAFDKRVPFNMEYRLRSNDGTYRWISDNGKPVHQPDGTFAGYIGSCADINDLHTIHKKLEERVQQRTLELNKALEREHELSELKSKFVSIASHEFRTPLSALLSSASLAQQYISRSETEKARGHLDKIKTAVTNLNDILNDFLSLEKLEQGRVEVASNEINFREFSMSIVDDLAGILKSGQTVEAVYEGDETIQQDQHLLRNILINLLSNASKYSNEGVIGISIRNTDVNFIVRVQDNGIGIPEDQQRNIFTSFFRANNTGNIQGTGLGLSIVKRYVELLGGNITFESKYGEGTVFTVDIPHRPSP